MGKTPAVLELDAGQDGGDQMRSIDTTPALLGGLAELESHGQGGLATAGAAGLLGTGFDGAEGGLDGIGGAQVQPMLGGIIQELWFRGFQGRVLSGAARQVYIS